MDQTKASGVWRTIPLSRKSKWKSGEKLLNLTPFARVWDRSINGAVDLRCTLKETWPCVTEIQFWSWEATRSNISSAPTDGSQGTDRVNQSHSDTCPPVLTESGGRHHEISIYNFFKDLDTEISRFRKNQAAQCDQPLYEPSPKHYLSQLLKGPGKCLATRLLPINTHSADLWSL